MGIKNLRESKFKTAARTKEHRKAAFNRARGVVNGDMALAELQAWRKPFKTEPRPAGRIVVTLTRLAPRKLDKNGNIQLAFSAVADGIAEALQIDDRDDVYEWKYPQQKTEGKKYGVLVTIEIRGAEATP
jgi:hypothetical protein